MAQRQIDYACRMEARFTRGSKNYKYKKGIPDSFVLSILPVLCAEFAMYGSKLILQQKKRFLLLE